MIDAASEAIGTEIHPSMPRDALADIASKNDVKVAPVVAGQNHRGNLRGSLRIRHREAHLYHRPSRRYFSLSRVHRDDPFLTERFELFVDRRNLRMDIPSSTIGRATSVLKMNSRPRKPEI